MAMVRRSDCRRYKRSSGRRLHAESEGTVGYLIEQELRNELPDGHMIARLFSQISVSRSDPAFQNPTKLIGPVYNEAEAKRIAKERGWSIAPNGIVWRRIVPSPEPIEILEARVIEYLFEAQVTVIRAGGGIPVIARADGSIVGVEAVIDKDRTSALLAAIFAPTGCYS